MSLGSSIIDPEYYETADSVDADDSRILNNQSTQSSAPVKKESRTTWRPLLQLIITVMLQKLHVASDAANGHYEFLQSAYDKLLNLEKVLNKLSFASRKSTAQLSGYPCLSLHSPGNSSDKGESVHDSIGSRPQRGEQEERDEDEDAYYSLVDNAFGVLSDEMRHCDTLITTSRHDWVNLRSKLESKIEETIREYEAAQHDMRGDGTLIWCVRRFGELVRDTQQTSRYSKRFQTPEGFEFRLRMFPNGAGKGKNSHISVFVQMCRTETDPMLPYPFQGLCIVTLYDQNTSRGKKEHYTVKFKTNSSSCFQRPTSEFNPENGVAQFVSHDLLRAHTNNSDTKGDKPVYMHNNTIFIGAEIRYTNNLLKLFNSPGKNNVGDKDSGNSRKSNSSAGGNGREESNSSVGSSISHSSGNESSTSELGGNMTTATEDHSAMDTA